MTPPSCPTGLAAAHGSVAAPDLLALDRLGVPFVCHGPDAEATYVSPSAGSIVRLRRGLTCHALEQLCRAVRQVLSLRARGSADPAFVLARELPSADGLTVCSIYRRPRRMRDSLAALTIIRPSPPHATRAAVTRSLTAREFEIASLLVEGLTTREAAARAKISPHTARHHVEHVYAKLGLRSRHALVRLLVASHDGEAARSLTPDRSF